MKLIAHRGNFDGIQLKQENTPEYLKRAIKLGYDVEIDARYLSGTMWLGHDEPTYPLSQEDFMFFLVRKEVWWHAKDYTTLATLMARGSWIKTFAHESDHCALVSGGFVWTADTNLILEPYNRTVFMVLETIERLPNLADKNPYAICTDNFVGLKP